MYFKQKPILVVFVMVSLFLLVACGGSSESADFAMSEPAPAARTQSIANDGNFAFAVDGNVRCLRARSEGATGFRRR